MNIASIDIGTNTVILLIADISGNKLNPLINEFRIPRIGKGLITGNNISEEKIRELLYILSEYKNIIDEYNCKETIAIATNAFRTASNTKNITDLIKKENWNNN